MLRKFALIIFTVNFLSGALYAEDILKKLGGDKGFMLTFQQKSFYKFLKEPKISSGSLLYSPPDNFVWEIKGDNAGKVVSNGKKTWIFSPAEEQGDTPTVIVREKKYDGIQSIIFGEKYDTSMLKEKDGLLELTVKGGKDKGYLSATLRFKESPSPKTRAGSDNANFSLDSIEFDDIENTKIVVKVKTFRKLSKNASTDTFIFRAPRGTRSIRE
ncbi:MAG: outer-membrane lipoprotein carrier protein LolA [Pseudomonadota bacterium]